MIDFLSNKKENNNSNNSMNNNSNKNDNFFSIYDKFMELKKKIKILWAEHCFSNKGCVSLSCRN